RSLGVGHRREGSGSRLTCQSVLASVRSTSAKTPWQANEEEADVTDSLTGSADAAVDGANAKTDTTMWTGLLHAGLVGTFRRLPHVAPDTDALKRHGAKAAVYGLPFDATNISRTGANYGPRGIREVSCQFTTYNATFDFDLLATLNPVDCGDC